MSKKKILDTEYAQRAIWSATEQSAKFLVKEKAKIIISILIFDDSLILQFLCVYKLNSGRLQKFS